MFVKSFVQEGSGIDQNFRNGFDLCASNHAL